MSNNMRRNELSNLMQLKMTRFRSKRKENGNGHHTVLRKTCVNNGKHAKILIMI